VKLTLATINGIPKVRDLLVSPDGRRLLLDVETSEATRFRRSLWETKSDGSTPARPVTPILDDLVAAAFLQDGTLVVAAPNPADGDAVDICVVRPGSDEIKSLVTIPGGIDAMEVAPDSGTVVVSAWVVPRAASLEDDARIARRRAEAGATAILFEELETRRATRELGPRLPRLLRFDVEFPDAVVDLVPDAGGALVGAEFAISRDGTTVVTTWRPPIGQGFRASQLLAIDGTGRRVLATEGALTKPAISPDGRWVVAEKLDEGSPSEAERMSLWLVDPATGEGTDLTGDFERWPERPLWAPDGASVVFVADDRGRSPVFRVDVGSRRITPVATDATYTSVRAAPDGALYAISHTYAAAPSVVRLDGPRPTVLPHPGDDVELPGKATELTGRRPDGAEVHGHLVLPTSAGPDVPAPLVLWIHGQTRGWNAHNFWLWCPYLLAEHGYAVLMANPARSTGYGQEMMQRGWGYWGDNVLADLLAAVDEAVARPDIDESLTAAMGHSFGGHMANWLAGRTDRFRAIVNCAGVWAFDQFQGTTDKTAHWEFEFGDPYADPHAWVRNSPRVELSSITTPMLIVHGLKDYNVPISEPLREWTDLKRHDVPSSFLLFPESGHYLVHRPSDVVVLYATVLAFLDHHVLGRPWELPDLLG
jgi:dipeptidyl aminopeptidase/acylaminoacyl peptidase